MLDYFLQPLRTLVENDQTLYTIFVGLAAVTVMVLCLGLGVFVLGVIDPLRMRLRWFAGEQPKKKRQAPHGPASWGIQVSQGRWARFPIW